MKKMAQVFLGKGVITVREQIEYRKNKLKIRHYFVKIY